MRFIRIWLRSCYERVRYGAVYAQKKFDGRLWDATRENCEPS